MTIDLDYNRSKNYFGDHYVDFSSQVVVKSDKITAVGNLAKSNFRVNIPKTTDGL